MFPRLVILCSLLLAFYGKALSESPDAGTLKGKVMCGYQGWFQAKGDSLDQGWQHYGFKEGETRCQIDLWPDLTGFGEDELFVTPLKYGNGEPAKVYTSIHPQTVRRHFDWMKEHDIDGVFLQRFGVSIRDPKHRQGRDEVMKQVRASAQATGRTWCVMYDLTGLKAGELESVVMQDWKRLLKEWRVTEDATYQRHAGKPVVAVWGIGFNDDRGYGLEESAALLRFLRNNPEFGGMCVMAGIPWGWRTLDRDSTRDAQLHEVLQHADILSPWAVGRYGTMEGARKDITKVHTEDEAWCKQRGKTYLPVIFPGFSWRNLMKTRGQDAPLDAIPRLKGQFLWEQAHARMAKGAEMLYVAMFDEMDEATAIFKFSQETPVGTEGFVNETGVPSDHYLWLTGRIGKSLRKELPLTEAMPERKP